MRLSDLSRALPCFEGHSTDSNTVPIPRSHWGCCYPPHLLEWSCKTLQLLFRSMIENSRLTAKIRSVSLHMDYEYNFDYEDQYLESYPEQGTAEPEIYVQAMTVVHRLDIDDQSLWSDALKSNSIDAWIALLLSQLASLESLTLGPPLLHHAEFTGKMFKRLAKSGHFNRLRRVVFGENLEGYQMAGLSMPNELVIPLFSLPLLGGLELTLTDPMVKSWDTEERTSQTLKELRLHRCHINGDDMDGLLSLTPALRELHCGFLRDARESDSVEKINYNRLHQALSCVSETLEILTLNIRWNDKNCDCFGVELGILGQLPMPPLTGFGGLKRLEIPIELLLGEKPWNGKILADILPPNLQSLTLKDEKVTWRLPLELAFQQHRSGDDAMQEVIDVVCGYLEHPERHTTLERLDLDVCQAQSFKGNDLVDRETGRCISAQVEQLRKAAETAQIVLWVFFSREIRGLHCAGTLVVYDPADPEQPPTEWGLYVSKKANGS